MNLTPELMDLLRELVHHVATHIERDHSPAGWLSTMQGNPVLLMSDPHGLLAVMEKAGVSAETLDQWCQDAHTPKEDSR